MKTNGDLDLSAAYRTGMAKYAALDSRRDGAEPHLGGDVAGNCFRLSHERRRRAAAFEPPFERDHTTLALFAIGHAIEKVALDRIEAGLPTGQYMVRDVGCEVDGVVGHADAVIYEDGSYPPKSIAVIDVKSTTWWSQRDEYNRIVWRPKEVKPGHEIQVASYALALGAPKAYLFEIDCASKGERVTEVDVAGLVPLVKTRIAEVIDLTDPAKPAPEAMPMAGAEWMCGAVKRAKNKNTGQFDTIVSRAYCPHEACPRHVSRTEVVLT
jgi:hypothetical protein